MTRAGKLIVLLGLAFALAALGPTVAPSKDKTAPLYAKMKQRFTTKKPGASTGWKFDGALKPFPEGEQVPPQRSAVWRLPRGTRTDLRGVSKCRATDEQIVAEGLAACPPDSRVGSGSGSLFLGAVGIIDMKVAVFAARGELVTAFTTEAGAILRVIRATVRRKSVKAEIPSLELPGGYESAVTRFLLKIERGGTRKHPLIRTPKRCPKNRRWKFVYLPRYDEAYGVQRSTKSVRCRRSR